MNIGSFFASCAFEGVLTCFVWIQQHFRVSHRKMQCIVCVPYMLSRLSLSIARPPLSLDMHQTITTENLIPSHVYGIHSVRKFMQYANGTYTNGESRFNTCLNESNIPLAHLRSMQCIDTMFVFSACVRDRVHTRTHTHSPKSKEWNAKQSSYNGSVRECMSIYGYIVKCIVHEKNSSSRSIQVAVSAREF